MRNLSFKGAKCDKKFLIAFILSVILSVICGIVLRIAVDNSVYFNNFAQDYIFYVFNFKNTSLIFSQLFRDLLYFYGIFLICYFCKIRYFSLILLFVKGLFFGLYTAILFSVSAVGGAFVAIVVFIPSSLISIFLCYVIAASCKIINKKFAFAAPAIFALISCLVLVILVNVIFRLIIVIV